MKPTVWDEITIVDKQIEELVNYKKYLVLNWFHEKLLLFLEKLQTQHLELMIHQYQNKNQKVVTNLVRRLEHDNPNHLFGKINEFKGYFWYFHTIGIEHKEGFLSTVFFDLTKKMIPNQSYFFTKNTSLGNFFENFASQEINLYYLNRKLEASLPESDTHTIRKI